MILFFQGNLAKNDILHPFSQYQWDFCQKNEQISPYLTRNNPCYLLEKILLSINLSISLLKGYLYDMILFL